MPDPIDTLADGAVGKLRLAGSPRPFETPEGERWWKPRDWGRKSETQSGKVASELAGDDAGGELGEVSDLRGSKSWSALVSWRRSARIACKPKGQPILGILVSR